MPVPIDSDAEALWSDVLDMCERENTPKATVEMMRSCTPTALTEDVLHICTEQKFVQRTLSNNVRLIEVYLEKCAFRPVNLVVDLDSTSQVNTIDTGTTISADEMRKLTAPTQTSSQLVSPPQPSPIYEGAEEENRRYAQPRRKNPLVGEITESNSRLTFDRFVVGEENEIALQASKQVANGYKGFNPLFIYGKSGLGKTHLLKAIQNYVFINDPSRVCVYRTATEFRNDYVAAMVGTDRSVKEEFENNYHDVDLLIVDDIQGLKSSDHTTEFFFDLFNYLRDHGKQIVLAADRQPSELGAGGTGLDERLTSRIDSGMSYPISSPQYELKYKLIQTFCTQMREDAEREGVIGFSGTLTEDDMRLMAEKAGSNIRIIEGFCQSCLLTATRAEKSGKGHITREEIIHIANAKWPGGQRDIPVDQIQKIVEMEYGISHSDLIGNKRNKELMEPRHIAIWLTRELTDNTLADIGKKFGGRSHATVKHSIGWVDEASKTSHVLKDQLNRLEDTLRNQ